MQNKQQSRRPSAFKVQASQNTYENVGAQNVKSDIDQMRKFVIKLPKFPVEPIARVGEWIVLWKQLWVCPDLVQSIGLDQPLIHLDELEVVEDESAPQAGKVGDERDRKERYELNVGQVLGLYLLN